MLEIRRLALKLDDRRTASNWRWRLLNDLHWNIMGDDLVLGDEILLLDDVSRLLNYRRRRAGENCLGDGYLLARLKLEVV